MMSVTVHSDHMVWEESFLALFRAVMALGIELFLSLEVWELWDM